MITSVIALIIQILPILLQTFGVVSPQIQDLIVKLAAAIPGLITSLVQGGGPTQDIMDVLEALQPEIAALKADTKLDPEALQMAETLDGAITDALADWKEATATTDPSTLTELPTTF